MHYDPAPHLPAFVIVDLTEPVNDFISKAGDLEILGIDTDAALADALDNIQRKDLALQTVDLSNQEILSSYAHEDFGGDVKVYVGAREALCREMYRQFCLLGLYVNGVLYYQFKELFRGALVLQKIEVPFTDATHRARHIARQAAVAHERYIPRVEAPIAPARVRAFGSYEGNGSRGNGAPGGSISIQINF